MYKIKRVDDRVLLDLQKRNIGQTVFTTYAWIQFLKKNQKIESVVLEVVSDEKVVAYFVGGIISKFGMKILGSPFEGWLTCDMGFIEVDSNIDYNCALKDVADFAFCVLKCKYIQVIDKKIAEDNIKSDIKYYKQDILWLNLEKGEEETYRTFTKSAKRYIRQCNDRQTIKSVKFDKQFVDIYYSQLIGIFERQNLKPTFTREKIYDLSETMEKYPDLVCAEMAFREDGECTGTCLTFGFGNWAYYLCAANSRTKNNCHPGEGLFWSMTKHWISKGIENMDLVGVRDYKRRYSPQVQSEMVIYFERIPGLKKGKDFARKVVEFIRKIQGKKDV